MKNLILFLWVSLFAITVSAETETALSVIQKKLESNVYWLLTTQPTKKDVLAKFGPPSLEEKGTLYYELNDYKYSLSINFVNDKVSYASYRLPNDTKLEILDFKSFFKAKDYSLYPSSGHDKGREVFVAVKKENIQLYFSNNSQKKLSKIIYEQK